MQFTVDKDSFLKNLIISDSAVSAKNSNTILSYCLFNIENNILEISGTDNDISIRTVTDVVSNVSFSFASNPKKIIQIIKEIPKGEISVDVDDSYNIIIKSNIKELKGKYKLPGADKSDFPILPRINKKEAFEVEQSVFKDMIKNVSYAASTDVIKPSFNGVYFISEKKGFMSVVASDSRRLSICSRSFSDEVEIKEGVIIPLKTINDLLKILGNGKCFILVKNNQCFFKIDNTEIITRVIDGQFPNYKQVIPVDYIKKVYVKKDYIIDSLRRVMVFTKEPSYKVYLHFLSDKIKIEAKTAEIGEGFEEITAESNNKEDISLGINSQYLLDSIKDIDFDIIEIGITGVMSPLCIKNEKDEHTTAVIMPIQIKSGDNEN
jgi:DNA polymerase III subunit beta